MSNHNVAIEGRIWTWGLLAFLSGMLLTVMAVPAARAQQGRTTHTETWQPAEAPLLTRWADEVSPGNAWPEYPRPQMKRADWKNLNGLWHYAIMPKANDVPQGYEGEILVPFAVEAALSGVGHRVGPDSVLWYHRAFEVPEEWAGQRVLLHFGAVDWDATVYVNGEEVGTHQGGYDAFTLDITDALEAEGSQELVVRVWDPTDAGNQPRGKQVREPGGIWYTPVTGIWQTVWLEPVPSAHITDLKMTPDIDRDVLRLTVDGSSAGETYEVEAVALAEGEVVGEAQGQVGEEIVVPVPDARLWSPKHPFLYDLRVTLLQDGQTVDQVESYFGMRKIEIGKDDDGTPRILLNGEFVFQLGPLDQGYWPGGLYTAPTDEALRYDLEMTKKLGFNMTRKHVKVEPRRWYYWADQLGLLVWQDMPNGDNATPESQEQFGQELDEMIDQLRNHPSIIAWVVFNEGWGQFDAAQMAEEVEQLDSSRLVVDVSGWQHMGAGDVIDVHRYQGPVAIRPEGDRASIVGEFGGLGHAVDGHTWTGEGWGYQGTYETREQLTDRYELLIKRMWYLKDWADMSAGIYTQLTDVEVEVNGLMTYDRDVLKMDTSRVVAVNKGITPYILPEEERFIMSATVRLLNGVDDTEIRYTLDGSEPTAASTRYVEPFTIDQPTTVKARAFRDGTPRGPVVTKAFEAVEGRAPVASVDASGLERGLRYRYYEAAAEQRSRFQQHGPLRRQLRQGDVLEPVKTGTAEHFSLAPHERETLFALAFEGYLKVPRDGVYTFFFRVDDGINVLVGDTSITERAGQSPWTVIKRASIPLQAGLHPITLRYFQAYGPSHLEVYYEGPGIEKQPLPDAALFHSVNEASK